MKNRKPRQSASELLDQLIAFDSEGRAIWPAEQLQAILRHQLGAPLSESLTMDAGTEGPASIRTFGELLGHAAPPVRLLRQIKEFAKANRLNRQSPVPPEICALFYYGSIIIALMRCNERITRLSDGDLRAGLNWLARQPWLDDDTRAVFLEGLRFLRSSRSKWRR